MKWHPSRRGFFYFSFNNGSRKSTCEGSEKLAIEVSSTMSPQLPLVAAPAPAPEPSSGGVISSSPVYMWPFRPRQSAASPSPGPSSVPSIVPDKGGIPFINSNPAVPLPTGEVDSATIRPLPTSAHGTQVYSFSFLFLHSSLCLSIYASI